MKIAIGCDHAGFLLKDTVIEQVKKSGHTPVDLGTSSTAPVDYPDFAQAVAQTVLSGKADRGIIICGSGVGACIAANKFKGIRAGLCHDTYSAAQGVEHDNMNVLCIGSRVIGQSLASSIISVFLNAVFSNESRHAQRLAKITKIEAATMK